MDYRIRVANKRDLKEFVKLRKELLNYYYRNNLEKLKHVNDKVLSAEFLNFLDRKKGMLLVAEIGNILVGYQYGTYIKNVWQTIGYIDDLFVLKEFRNKGIGRKLIGEFIRLCMKKGIKKFRLGVEVSNKKAISLYKKLGFKVTNFEMCKTY